MNMSKYGSVFLKPDDVRNGPLKERIANVYISEKFECPVLDFEGGDQLSLNRTNTRLMNKTYGTESDNWIGHVIELSLGEYKNNKDETQETVVVRPISLPLSGNNGGAKETTVQARPPAPPISLDDEIPF